MVSSAVRDPVKDHLSAWNGVHILVWDAGLVIATRHLFIWICRRI